VQVWCAWCGPVFATVLFVALLLMDFLPPPSPGMSAGEVAAFWRQDLDLKRAGLVLMLLGSCLTAPFVVVVAAQLRRMEGDRPVMTWMQLIGGGLGIFAIVLPTFMLAAAAYRPERDPEITQALTDLGLLPFIGNFVAATIQCLAIGVGILASRQGPQVYDRWVGYLNVWLAFAFLPGGLVLFFHGGAFGWSGVLNFWVVATIFGGWFVVMTWATLRAVRTDDVPALAARHRVAAVQREELPA